MLGDRIIYSLVQELTKPKPREYMVAIDLKTLHRTIPMTYIRVEILKQGEI